jgi:precorrin-6B methylase 2
MTEPYSHVSLHRWLLHDRIRNEAFRRALSAVVKPGDVVLDMGAGTGILSIFAAHAGASKVYAVERTEIAQVARRMIAQNGLSDRIVVVDGDLEDARLPEKADVLVSEWMGGIGVDENMLAPLVIARDRWLRPGGVIVPASVTAVLAPAWIEGLAADLAHWRARPHGVDMTVIADMTAHDSMLSQAPLGLSDLLAEPAELWTHVAATCTLEEADRPFEARRVFRARRAGKLSGLAAWFTSELAPGVTLTTAVGEPDTHWGHVLFPLYDTVVVTEGTPIEVDFRCEQSSPGSTEFAWAVRIGDRPVEEHHSRRSHP